MEKEAFAVTLKIKRGEENESVYYKQDGERFDSSYTIKMTVEENYKFTLTFRPPQVIDTASIKGSSVTLTEQEMSDGSSSYSFDWHSVAVCTTKAKKRDAVPLVLGVRNLGDLTVDLQVKFYKANDKNHSVWGNALHQIELDCSHAQGNSFVEVAKQVFR